MRGSGEATTVRLLGFVFIGMVLAGCVLAIGAGFRSPQDPPLIHATATIPATDGRAVAGIDDNGAAAIPAPPPLAARSDGACAAFARDRLMAGLTDYYLQRRARPGASSEDAADTSSVTGLLAGPGDPAARIPETACSG